MPLNRPPLLVLAAILVGTVVFWEVQQTRDELDKSLVFTESIVHPILALGLVTKAEIRADFEDALAAQLAKTGLDTIPGHTILLRPEGERIRPAVP
jgi:hypothetical protein